MFRDPILSGRKRQTIRKLRKYPIMVGDRLHLYWKLRTKDCEKLGEAICTETFFLRIGHDKSGKVWMLMAGIPNPKKGLILIEGHMFDIAKRDGFDSVEAMISALEKMHGDLHNSVFQVVRWGKLCTVAKARKK